MDANREQENAGEAVEPSPGERGEEGERASQEEAGQCVAGAEGLVRGLGEER